MQIYPNGYIYFAQTISSEENYFANNRFIRLFNFEFEVRRMFVMLTHNSALTLESNP